MSAVPSIPETPAATAAQDLFERYRGQIFAFCLHRLGSREEAEDAVQSTFLNAFRSLQRGVEPRLEGAWLFKIAENVCNSRHRSSSRRRRLEATSDLHALQDVVPSRSGEADELFGLSEALEAMPPQQRLCLVLREWHGLSYAEIAAELELSQSAVETLLFRARRSLARGLEEPQAPARRMRRRAGELGSLATLLKTFFFGGGVKVAATVATVAATSVAVSPPARHEVAHVAGAGAAYVEEAVRPARQASTAPERPASTPAARTNRPAPVAFASPPTPPAPTRPVSAPRIVRDPRPVVSERPSAPSRLRAAAPPATPPTAREPNLAAPAAAVAPAPAPEASSPAPAPPIAQPGPTAPPRTHGEQARSSHPSPKAAKVVPGRSQHARSPRLAAPEPSRERPARAGKRGGATAGRRPAPNAAAPAVDRAKRRAATSPVKGGARLHAARIGPPSQGAPARAAATTAGASRPGAEGHGARGLGTNGHGANGHAANGHRARGHGAGQRGAMPQARPEHGAERPEMTSTSHGNRGHRNEAAIAPVEASLGEAAPLEPVEQPPVQQDPAG